jgi:hypothetical protein
VRWWVPPLAVVALWLAYSIGFDRGGQVVQHRWLAAYHELKRNKIDCWRKDHNDETCLSRDVISGVEFEDLPE